MLLIPPRIAPRRKQRGFIINPYAYDGGGGGGDTDPYWSSVVQLAHFDGSNGSTTLTNSSSLGDTMTVIGSSTISTAQSKWGGASLRSPNMSSGAKSADVDIADYGFGQGAATIELWFWLDALSGNQTPVCWEGAGGSTGGLVYIDGSGVARLYIDSATRITSGAVISAATWHFLSYCTVGGTAGVARDHYMHIDGVHTGTWNNAYAYSNTGQLFVFTDSYGINGVGYADDFRVTKGVCRYTNSNYTPPAAAFPNS